MKFGAHLQNNRYTPWENEYIQYDRLKFYLKERQLSLTGWTKTDEMYFSENLVAAELDKVYQFIALKLKSTESRMREIQSNGFRMDFDAELLLLHNLLNFIELNSSGFQKIIKKHNKWTYADLKHYIRIRSIPQRFKSYKNRAEKILDDVNQLNYENKKKKKVETVMELNITQGNVLDNNVHETKTIISSYWIHPDNLSEVQATTLFNLSHINSTMSSQPYNSVFLDNPFNFTLYNNLIKQKRKAESVQMEWQEGKSESMASVELRVHNESSMNMVEYYLKDSFSLQQKFIKDYLKDPTIYKLENNNLSNMIQSKQLEPMIRSICNRSIYKQSEKSKLQVTIDTNSRFINEKKLKGEYNFRTINVNIDDNVDQSDKQIIQHFPFAIFEIKQNIDGNTPHSNQIPSWISDLVNTGLLYEVPLFSPYLHGISCFYPDRIPLLPWWLDEMKNDVRKGNYIQKPNCETEDEFFDTRSKHCNEVCRSEAYSVVNISDETTHNNIHTQQYNKPDEVHGVDLSSFGYTNYNIQNDEKFASFYSMINEIDFKDENQNVDSKASFIDDIFLENPVLSKIKNLKKNSYISYYEESNLKRESIGMASWLLGRLHRRNSGSAHGSIQEISAKQGKPKKKLEPKIFFANERTFISWLQFSAFLLTVSLGLINFGDNISRCCGGFFIVMSVFLAIYALLRFQYRSWQIRMRNDTRFDDTWGPAVLCVVLIIALIINLCLRINQPAPFHPSLFGLQQEDGMVIEKMGGDIQIHSSGETDGILEMDDAQKNGTINQKNEKENKKDPKKSEHKNESKGPNKNKYGKLNNSDGDNDDDDDKDDK